MNLRMSISISHLTAQALRIEAGKPWHSNLLLNAIAAGVIVGGSAALAVAIMSLIPGWGAVSLATTPTFCIASLLCATVIAVKSWSR